MSEREKILKIDMRLIYTGAADVIREYASVIEEYALSPAFDFEAHQDILRPIAQGAEKLMAILDAYKATKQ